MRIPAGSSMWRAGSSLILASGSKTRAQLLDNAGLAHQILPADIDERAVEASLPAGTTDPHDVAIALAVAKARNVAALHPGRWVLGADQTLDCAGVLFHKPADKAAAASQIAQLAGRRHRLTSAAALVRDGRLEARIVAEAWLSMRPLTPAAIAHYIDMAGEAATRSVGGYQLEGLGIHLFEAVEGDHFTILGLPLMPLLAQMRRLELVAP